MVTVSASFASIAGCMLTPPAWVEDGSFRLDCARDLAPSQQERISHLATCSSSFNLFYHRYQSR